MDQATVIRLVRSRLALSVSDMADAAVNDCIDGALKAYSHVNPLDVYGIVNIVVNVTDYPFATALVPFDSTPPSAVEEVQQVLYSPGTLMYDALSYDADLQKVVDADLLRAQFGGNVFDNPSLGKIYFQKLAEYRDRFDVEWQVFETSEGKILRLLRTPAAGSSAFWKGWTLWSLGLIHGHDEEVFIKAVFGEVSRTRAMQLAVMESYNERSGVSMQPAHKFWAQMADKFTQEYEDHFGARAGIVRRG